MVGKMLIIGTHVVINHLTVRANQRNTKILAFMFTDESLQLLMSHSHILIVKAVLQNNSFSWRERQIFCQQFIIIFQFDSKRTYFILFLSCLLEHDKTDGEYKEHRQYTEVQLSTYTI